MIQLTRMNLQHKYKKLWQVVVTALACAVIFFTFYTLILPAITLETDSTDIYYSSDLADFVDTYEILDIHNHPVTDGTVYVGETYYVRLTFKETNVLGDNKQFKNNSSGQLTYQFDNTNLSFTETDWGELIIRNSELGMDVPAARFKIDSNGKLILEYYEKKNDGTSTPGTVFFDHYSNCELNIDFTVTIDNSSLGDKLTVNLGNTVEIEVNAPKEAAISVDKAATTYLEHEHAMGFKVLVNCDYGAVGNLVLTDVAKLKDGFTGVEYGMDSGKFTIGDVVIKDAFGNVVKDSNDDPITDLADLPDTLTGGNGYEITYNVYLDDSFYDAGSAFKAVFPNTFTATAEDLDGNPLTSTKTVSPTIERRNMSKSAVPDGTVTIGGTEYPRIRWTVNVGDYNTVMSAFTLNDVLGEATQHYCTTIAPTYRISYPTVSNGTLAWGTTANVTTGGATDTCAFTMPAGGTRYELVYYTYTEVENTYTNTITLNPAPGGGVWDHSASAVIIKDLPVVKKELAGADEDNVYFKATIDVPGTQFGKKIQLQDTLSGEGCRYVNEPEDVEVKIYNHRTGETETVPQYTGTGDTAGTFKVWLHGEGGYFDDSQSQQFRLTFPSPTAPYYQNSLNSYWPYSDDVTMTVTYRTPKSTPTWTWDSGLVLGPTMYEKLDDSKYINNAMQVTYNQWDTLQDSVTYNEVTEIKKKGAVTDAKEGIIDYSVAYSNDRLPEGKYTYSTDKVPITPTNYTDAFFHDVMDERVEYVDDTLYAYIYERPRNTNYNLTTYYGENRLPHGVFKYTGEDIEDSMINAKWSDFKTFDYLAEGITLNKPTWFSWKEATQSVRYIDKIVIDPLYDLDQLMKSLDGGEFGIVFVYKGKVKEEYRSDLSKTENIMHLTNEADVNWTLSEGSYTVGPTSATVDFKTELLRKEFTHISEDDRIHYTITVNENGYDLTDKEHFTIQDTMCPDLSLLLTSVEIDTGEVDTETGDMVWTAYTGDPQISYDNATNTLRAVVPDDCPIRLSYDCRITKEGDVSLYNTVEITGFTKAVNTSNAVFSVSSSGGSSGGGSENWLYVRKNDSQTHVGLTGAVFALYGDDPNRYGDPDTIDAPETVVVHGDTLHVYGLYTTAANTTSPAMNGTFALDDMTILETSGHFALKEVVPPEGYLLNPAVFDFYWEEAPTTGADDDVPIYQDGDTLIINDDLNVEYTLPATGGYGTQWILIAGAFLTLAGMAALYNQNKKKFRLRKQNLS